MKEMVEAMEMWREAAELEQKRAESYRNDLRESAAREDAVRSAYDAVLVAESERKAAEQARKETAPIRCPTCSNVEAVPALNIKSYGIAVDGTVVESQIGYRVCCQSCSTVYSIGPRGVFRHHRDSLPLTDEVRRAPDEKLAAEANGTEPPAFQRPRPRSRPPV